MLCYTCNLYYNGGRSSVCLFVSELRRDGWTDLLHFLGRSILYLANILSMFHDIGSKVKVTKKVIGGLRSHDYNQQMVQCIKCVVVTNQIYFSLSIDHSSHIANLPKWTSIRYLYDTYIIVQA